MAHVAIGVFLLLLWSIARQDASCKEPDRIAARYYLRLALKCNALSLLLSFLFACYLARRLGVETVAGFAEVEDITLATFAGLGDSALGQFAKRLEISVMDHVLHAVVLTTSSCAWAVSLGMAMASTQTLIKANNPGPQAVPPNSSRSTDSVATAASQT
jgi:hypothetical protein